MSTRRNYNTPGHAHELTFSCYRGIPLLGEDAARQELAEGVNRACEEHCFRLWAYVFMPEHIHLLVWPEQREYDIAAFRHRVKAWTARRAIKGLEETSPCLIEKITRKRGKRIERLFWQPGGGYDRNIDRPETLRPVIDYIHMNPVRRGLVKMPEDWHWSSACWYREGKAGPCVVHPLTDAI